MNPYLRGAIMILGTLWFIIGTMTTLSFIQMARGQVHLWEIYIDNEHQVILKCVRCESTRVYFKRKEK